MRVAEFSEALEAGRAHELYGALKELWRNMLLS
jgi:hypothetical protein